MALRLSAVAWPAIPDGWINCHRPGTATTDCKKCEKARAWKYAFDTTTLFLLKSHSSIANLPPSHRVAAAFANLRKQETIHQTNERKDHWREGLPKPPGRMLAGKWALPCTPSIADSIAGGGANPAVHHGQPFPAKGCCWTGKIWPPIYPAEM